MSLLNEEITTQVREAFVANLQHEVEMLYFSKADGCDYCDDTRQLLEEVTSLSPKLKLSIYDLDQDAGLAKKYRVDKAPTTVIAARDGDKIDDYGIRLLGIPSGHEFSTLIQDLILVSGRESGLDEITRLFLSSLTKPIHLQVFVTPTCPYCPPAVVLAHRMALESKMVQAEMVESMEFAEMAVRFGVNGVPQTTINAGEGTLVGAVPEAYLVEEIKKMLKI